MKTAVITFPASNCNRDAAVALEKITGEPPVMVWHRERELPQGIDLLYFPVVFLMGTTYAAALWLHALLSSKTLSKRPIKALLSQGFAMAFRF